MIYLVLLDDEPLLLLLPLRPLLLFPLPLELPLLPPGLFEALPPLAEILLLVSGSIEAKPLLVDPLILRSLTEREDMPLPSPEADLPEFERLVRDIDPRLWDEAPLLLPYLSPPRDVLSQSRLLLPYPLPWEYPPC